MEVFGDQVGTHHIKTLIEEKNIIICAGSGGVGKTTLAAALGLLSAKLGRRACVVTIDPAKRLANALGIDELSNTPTFIDTGEKGELWAMMLDARATFDDLIFKYASSPNQASSIINNRLYKSLSTSLGGTQEYMAAEKLYELSQDSKFDLVIVDTPPSRNALDFLDGPGRLARFLENRLFRFILMPTRVYLKAVSFATQSLLKTISKVAGTELVSDAVEFFQAFEGMEGGFRDRAKQVELLFSDPLTAFVLIAAPRRDSASEAKYFAIRLKSSGIQVQGLIVNRVHPTFPELTFNDRDKVLANEDIKVLIENLDHLKQIREKEESYISDLKNQIGDAPVALVPLMIGDVHDLDGLKSVANVFS